MEMSNYNSSIDVSPSSRGQNKERHVCADYGAVVITVPKKATFFVLVEFFHVLFLGRFDHMVLQTPTQSLEASEWGLFRM